MLEPDMYPKSSCCGSAESAPAATSLETTLLHLVFDTDSRHGVMTFQGSPGQFRKLAIPISGGGFLGLIRGDVHVSCKLLTSAVFEQSELTVLILFFDIFINFLIVPFRLRIPV